MKFGKVIGTVVSTQKDANLIGVTLLVIQPLDQDLTPKGASVYRCRCYRVRVPVRS